MLRPVSTLVVAIAFAAISVEASYCSDLKIGECCKPPPSEVSGRVNNTFPIRRSPCPALNTLANCGYLPRDGQEITKGALKKAVMDWFNMADDTASRQVKPFEGVFSLDIMGISPFDHAASMVRADAYLGFDPAIVNITLVNDVLKRADKNGMIDTPAVASVRKDRALTCARSNPQCQFGDAEQRISFFQAALFLMGLGQGDFISVDHARSFLLDEKFPDGYIKSAVPLTLAVLQKKADVLRNLAG